MKALFTQLDNGKWLLWPGAEGGLPNLTFDSKIPDPLIGPHDALQQYRDNPHKYAGLAVLYGPIAICPGIKLICFRMRWNTIEVALPAGDRHPHRRQFSTEANGLAKVTISDTLASDQHPHQIAQLHYLQLDRDIEEANRLLKRAKGLIKGKSAQYNGSHQRKSHGN
ncbi:MAG TPA: hypothetical protein VLF21_02470 [Candidatus Saccharimonadales bacterium]|nr:hypothetical protein [Candidatus Saccharimonadales bacterium]